MTREVWYQMKSSKSDRQFISREVIIGMFLKKLYEERMLSNDEYVIALQLLEEKYPTQERGGRDKSPTSSLQIATKLNTKSVAILYTQYATHVKKNLSIEITIHSKHPRFCYN